MKGKSTDAPGLGEIWKLCREHVEALHNLLFLLGHQVEPESTASNQLRQAKMHLECVTDVLCRRSEPS